MLESITICTPSFMPFSSIQNCNVGTGLRHWMEPKAGTGGKAVSMQLKKIAVRTGVDEPLGWQQAQRGVQEVRDFVRQRALLHIGFGVESGDLIAEQHIRRRL